MGDRRSERGARIGRAFTLFVTNTIKLAGVYVALRAAVTEPTPSVIQIAEACFMMTGAQVTEDAILRLVGRLFGVHEEPGKNKDPQ